MVQVAMTKQMLSEPWKRLLEVAQLLNFGCVVVVVRGGQPDFTRPFRTVRKVRLTGGDNGPRAEAQSADFELRKEVKSLLDQVSRAPDGAILTVRVEHGLPVHIEIAEEHEA